MQLFSTVLVDVCYRLYAVIVRSKWLDSNDPRHHLHDLFVRRLKRGQCYRTPCLGWSEFTCSYWGPFRPDVSEVDAGLEMEIPSMLFAMWDDPPGGSYRPIFHQDLRVKEGVMLYRVPESWLDGLSWEEASDA